VLLLLPAIGLTACVLAPIGWAMLRRRGRAQLSDEILLNAIIDGNRQEDDNTHPGAVRMRASRACARAIAAPSSSRFQRISLSAWHHRP
jgi:hypothetical protein